MLMEATEHTRMQEELAQRIQEGTGGRVRELAVEVLPECVVLRGRTTSWYIKQLAQHSVSKFLPRVGLRNAIVVVA